MGGGVVFDGGVRFVVDFVCSVGACTRIVSWSNSGSLGGGGSENSLM